MRQATPVERTEFGRKARAVVPRSSHGEWAPPAGRTDPLQILALQGTTRIPDLVPIRYGRMAASAFAFFRGAAAVMAADLAAEDQTGLEVQLCGDAHLSNFGGFASPERDLIFDVNDFDETIPGPFEWDLKRLAASVEIAARGRELDDATRHTIVAGVGCSYRQAMRQFAGMRDLDIWYTHLDGAGHRGAVGRPGQPQADRDLPAADGQGPVQGPPGRPGQADPRGGRRAALRREPAADGAGRVAVHRRLLEPDGGPTSTTPWPQYRRHPVGGPAAAAGEVRVRRPGPQGGGGGQRGHPVLGGPVRRPGQRRPALPPGQGGRGRGGGAVPGPASPATMASGWWRASASCRGPATSSWAGTASGATTGSPGTSTSASCGTGSSPPPSKP